MNAPTLPRRTPLLAGLAACALLSAALTPAFAAAPAAQPPGKPGKPNPGKPEKPGKPGGKVKATVKAKGSKGCKDDNVAVAVSDDNQVFTVTYSDFQTAIEPDSKPVDKDTLCSVSVGLDAPAGFTYAVTKVDQRGYGSIEAGADAALDTQVSVEGGKKSPKFKRDFVGPFNQDFTETYLIPDDAVTWSPCGKAATITVSSNLKLKRKGAEKTSSSIIQMDSTDVSTGTVLGMAWKAC